MLDALEQLSATAELHDNVDVELVAQNLPQAHNVGVHWGSTDGAGAKWGEHESKQKEAGTRPALVLAAPCTRRKSSASCKASSSLPCALMILTANNSPVSRSRHFLHTLVMCKRA